MYFKLLSFTTLSLFTLPLLVSGQIKPGPSQIVCVVAPDETPAALVSDPAWKNPRVGGFLIRQSWAALEPAPGNYNFTLLDRAVQLAHENGKFVGLSVGGGTLSPNWLYASGAIPFRAKGEKEKMPLPWDPVFQSAWSSTVEALGNRYDKDSAVAYVVLSGVGRDYDSSLFSAPKDVSDFEAQGGALFWSHAASDISDLYATSFPHTQIVYPVAPVVPGAMGARLTEAVVTEEIEARASQFGVSTPPDSSDASADASAALPATTTTVSRVGFRIGSSVTAAASPPASYTEVPSQEISQATDPNSGATSDTASAGSSASSSPAASAAAPDTSVATTAANNAAISASMASAAEAAADSGNPIWVTAAPGTTTGTGTQSNPLNFSTVVRFDGALYRLAFLGKSKLVIHFLAGTYYTANPAALVDSGWQMLGAGRGQTIIKLDSSAITYTAGHKEADYKEVLTTCGSGGVLIENMTLDANCTGFGSQLSAAFAMPAPRATVTVAVADTTPFTVGKWVYVQDSVPTAGVNLYYGLMEVTAIVDSTHLTLKNSELATPGAVRGNLVSGSPVVSGISTTNLEESQAVSGPGIPAGTKISAIGTGQITLNANATATTAGAILNYAAAFMPNEGSNMSPTGNVDRGTVIPPTAHIMVAVCVGGIIFGYLNDTIENVDVRNVAEPFYEDAAGICVNGYNKNSTVLVQNCTVSGTWGTNAWLISLNNTKGVSLIGNSVTGNGYHQGYAFVSDNSGTKLQNNSSVGCQFALFSDTGTKSNLSVTGNTLEGRYCINFSGAAVTDSTFSNNTIKVLQSGGIGMQFVYVQLTNCTFSQNNVSMASGLIDVRGITFEYGCQGSDGNVFSHNIIDSDLPNSSDDSAYGTEIGNVDQDGQPVSLGLNE